MAAQTAQPWRLEPVIRPSVYVRPEGIAKISTISKKVGEWCGVLEWMRAVGSEESASIRTEFLNHLLRCQPGLAQSPVESLSALWFCRPRRSPALFEVNQAPLSYMV